MTVHNYIIFINGAKALRAIPTARNPISAEATGAIAVIAEKKFNIFFDDDDDNIEKSQQDKIANTSHLPRLLSQQSLSKRCGRPSKNIDPQVVEDLINSGLNYKAISRQLGVSVKTVQRTLKKITPIYETIEYVHS